MRMNVNGTNVKGMKEQKVSVIPASKRAVRAGGQMSGQTTADRARLRVAAYCRVSTDEESQQTSYETQRRYYTDLISRKQEWMLAGIYADEAISGTSRAHRAQFNQMISDAKSGKIDYIITKSISRFARNTVDTLECVRELRTLSPPVGVFFQKENIDSLDAKGELILTILSALAQDESRGISDNIRWSFQKNFEAGKPQLNFERMLGYDKGENGEWIINEAQAEIVRFIFHSFVDGMSANRIATRLNEMGKTTVNGKPWRADAVLCILRNEKHVGDLRMQKTVTQDYLTHKSVVNTGEAPQYYLRDHHKGIIDRLTWDRAQAIFAGKAEKREKNRALKAAPRTHIFSNIECGECGARFRRYIYSGVAKNYEDERSLAASGIPEEDAADYRETWTYVYAVWRCEEKYRAHEKKPGRLSAKEKETGDGTCVSPVVCEPVLRQSIMEMLYSLKWEYAEKRDDSTFARNFRDSYEILRRISENNGNRERLEAIEKKIAALNERYQDAVEKKMEAMQQEGMFNGAAEAAFAILGSSLAEENDSFAEEYAQSGGRGRRRDEYGRRDDFDGRDGFGGRDDYGGRSGFGDRNDYRGRDGSGGRDDYGRRDRAGGRNDYRSQGNFGGRDSYGGRDGFSIRNDYVDRDGFGSRDGSGGQNDYGGRDGFGGRDDYGGRSGSGGQNDYGGRDSYGGRDGFRIRNDNENCDGFGNRDDYGGRSRYSERDGYGNPGRKSSGRNTGNGSYGSTSYAIYETENDSLVDQIGTRRSSSLSDIYAQLAEDLKQKIDDCQWEKEQLEKEQSAAGVMQQNFNLFLECLMALPETNRAGLSLRIGAVPRAEGVQRESNSEATEDAKKTVAGKRITAEIRCAMDYLEFDQSIYASFFPKAMIRDGELHLFTNFGIRLICRGITRSMDDFLGYRRCTEDGKLELLTEKWQLSDKPIRYRRTEKAGGKK